MQGSLDRRCHVRGCLERISNLLGDPYNVIGITKPYANLFVITSSFNLKTEVIQ